MTRSGTADRNERERGEQARGGARRRSVLVATGMSASAVLLGAGPAFAQDPEQGPGTPGGSRTPGGPGTGAGRFAESVVWAAGEDGVVEHFLYGLVVTARGTVLACSEARLDASDTGAHHITVKRSTDAATTWSASTLVETSTGGECWANPTLVADPSTGRVMLFYALNYDNDSSRVFVRASRDDGRSWSDRTEITGLFAADPSARPFHLPGPGHGIALSDGRLVVQVWHRQSVTLPADQRAYGASVITSDDHGVSWQAGGTIPVDPVYPVNESRLFERSDGALVLNGRYSSGGVHPRITSVSTDRGRTWAPPVFDPAIRLYTAVDSGLTRLSGGVGQAGPSRLLFSRPDSTTARQNMVVSISYDEGRSFPVEKVLHPGPAAYSDLAHLADGTALVLYGKDTSAGRPVDHVAVARFGLDWLTDGHDRPHTGPVEPERVYEAETTAVVSTSGLRTVGTADPYAAGRRGLLLRGAAPGASVTFRITLDIPGHYQLVVRCRVTPDGPSLAAAVDGDALGVTVSTALADGDGYAELSCGSHLFVRAGAHTVTLTVMPPAAGTSPAADADIELDYLALRAEPA